ncbi:MAG TPA: hypothetical protein VJ692_11145 [Nitrospiraceae bacterium]|nr:hypothetical protein [Nitrospiraceae bacterium]
MPYLKSAYGDHNHFTSARVIEFRKRFKRASWHQTVRIPAETVGITMEEKPVRSTMFTAIKPVKPHEESVKVAS